MKHKLILKSGDGRDEFIEIRLTPPSSLEKDKITSTPSVLTKFAEPASALQKDKIAYKTTYHIPPVRVSHKAWEEDFKKKKESSKRLKGASWVWSNFRLTDEEARYGGLVTYYKYFYIPQNSRILEYSISITADDVYKLYINGEEVGYSNDWGRVDTFNKEHPTYIHPGKNYLIVTAFNTPLPGAQQHEDNPAGIIFKANIVYRKKWEVRKKFGEMVRLIKGRPGLFFLLPMLIAITLMLYKFGLGTVTKITSLGLFILEFVLLLYRRK